MKKNLAALHTQIIVCSHVTVASVLFSGTQLVPHTNQHSLESRNHNCTKYHFLYILGMLDAEIAAWNVACEIATDTAYKSMCWHVSTVMTGIACIQKNRIYNGNGISTSLQSSRIIMLTYAPPSWSRRRLLETQKAWYTFRHEQDARAKKIEPACKSMCSQMFHRHDRCRVFQKAAYLTASISVCHFNRAELLLSDALDHHDLGAVCIEGRPHMYSAVQPATVLANCQLPIPKQLSTSVSSEGNSHHNPFRPGETD